MDVVLQNAAVAAAQHEATAFAARYPADPPNVQFISFADVQKGIVANATQLGIIDTTNPWCAPHFTSVFHLTELAMYACCHKKLGHASSQYGMQDRVSYNCHLHGYVGMSKVCKCQENNPILLLCSTLDAVKAAYATSNVYEMGTLVSTHPGAVVSSSQLRSK